eukprot:UC1_evm1s2085
MAAEEHALAARRARRDRVSSAIGEKLLQRWCMLAESCPQCGTVLMRDPDNQVHCLGCTFVEDGEPSPAPSLTTTASPAAAAAAAAAASASTVTVNATTTSSDQRVIGVGRVGEKEEKGSIEEEEEEEEEMNGTSMALVRQRLLQSARETAAAQLVSRTEAVAASISSSSNGRGSGGDMEVGATPLRLGATPLAPSAEPMEDETALPDTPLSAGGFARKAMLESLSVRNAAVNFEQQQQQQQQQQQESMMYQQEVGVAPVQIDALETTDGILNMQPAITPLRFSRRVAAHTSSPAAGSATAASASAGADQSSTQAMAISLQTSYSAQVATQALNMKMQQASQMLSQTVDIEEVGHLCQILASCGHAIGTLRPLL